MEATAARDNRHMCVYEKEVIKMSDKKEQNPIRARFRQDVFMITGGRCCVPWCENDAVDAHHIIERALWHPDLEHGGYIKDNGAPLCAMHHMDAERGFITPNQLRQWCHIETPVFPKSMNAHFAFQYDKWGKEIPYPSRPFVMPRYRVKYPHTPFFRNSPGGNVSEKRKNGVIPWKALCNKDVIFTVKMDGSNAIFDFDGIAARNAQVATHSSFDLLKAMHAGMPHLPENLEFFCEWLYAKHSIHYTGENSLPDYLQLFGIYDHRRQEWLGWQDVEEWAKYLHVSTVPKVDDFFQIPHQGYPRVKTRYTSPKELESAVRDWGKLVVDSGHEGIVVRSMYSFPWNEFGQNIGKYVRKDHVTTDTHWSNQRIIRNEVR